MFGEADEPSQASVLAGLLERQFSTFWIVDFRKLDQPPPDELGVPLFDWLPDEVARQSSPLIISGGASNTDQTEVYQQADLMCQQLSSPQDYRVNHRFGRIALTGVGQDRLAIMAKGRKPAHATASGLEPVLNPATCKRPARIASICAALDWTGKNCTRFPVTAVM